MTNPLLPARTVGAIMETSLAMPLHVEISPGRGSWPWPNIFSLLLLIRASDTHLRSLSTCPSRTRFSAVNLHALGVARMATAPCVLTVLPPGRLAVAGPARDLTLPTRHRQLCNQTRVAVAHIHLGEEQSVCQSRSGQCSRKVPLLITAPV